jgi:hypothetical protein
MNKRNRTKDTRSSTRVPLKHGDELRWSGRVSSFCSTSVTRRVTDRNIMLHTVCVNKLQNKWRKDEPNIVFTRKYCLRKRLFRYKSSWTIMHIPVYYVIVYSDHHLRARDVWTIVRLYNIQHTCFARYSVCLVTSFTYITYI